MPCAKFGDNLPPHGGERGKKMSVFCLFVCFLFVTGWATTGIKITQVSNFVVFRPTGATRFTE